jgi:thiamine transport system substrate-binding protein
LICAGLLASACSSDDSGTEPVDTEDPPTSDGSTRASDDFVPTTDAANDDDTTPDTSGTSDGTDPDTTSATTAGSVGDTLTLVAYDSFPEEGTSLNEALEAFTADTGIGVEVLVAGDTGTMLAKAALTVGNPEGDIIFGIDNTFLSRAVNDGIFELQQFPPVADIPAEFTKLVPNGEAVPVDFGDVCVNYDISRFADTDLPVPTSLDDLADPAYADLLVVQNPATSSPGLAFLLATIDEFGVDGWQAYWEQLVANGVLVIDGWTEAYYGSFSGAGDGDRPLVVSYGSSPPAEVIFADPPRDDAPTGVIESTCFRQIEFAGILAGTDQPKAARQLLEFLVGETFQSELALNLFVYPTNASVELPQEFVDFAVVPDDSRTLDPELIDVNRSEWIDEWTTLVLG